MSKVSRIKGNEISRIILVWSGIFILCLCDNISMDRGIGLNHIDIYSNSNDKCNKDNLWLWHVNEKLIEIEINNSEDTGFSQYRYNANNPNEDNYSIYEMINFKGYLLSVFDGHGGFELSQYANERIGSYIDKFYKEEISRGETENNTNTNSYIINSINKAFTAIENEFLEIARKSLFNTKSPNLKFTSVGSCATVILLTPNKIFSAQLGDSKAKLYRKSNISYFNKSTKYDIIKLTKNHNSAKKDQQDLLKKQFSDKDIVVCHRGNSCYVKGRLQPTRVNIILSYYFLLFLIII